MFANSSLLSYPGFEYSYMIISFFFTVTVVVAVTNATLNMPLLFVAVNFVASAVSVIMSYDY